MLHKVLRLHFLGAAATPEDEDGDEPLYMLSSGPLTKVWALDILDGLGKEIEDSSAMAARNRGG